MTFLFMCVPNKNVDPHFCLLSLVNDGRVTNEKEGKKYINKKNANNPAKAEHEA